MLENNRLRHILSDLTKVHLTEILFVIETGPLSPPESVRPRSIAPSTPNIPQMVGAAYFQVDYGELRPSRGHYKIFFLWCCARVTAPSPTTKSTIKLSSSQATTIVSAVLISSSRQRPTISQYDSNVKAALAVVMPIVAAAPGHVGVTDQDQKRGGSKSRPVIDKS